MVSNGHPSLRLPHFMFALLKIINDTRTTRMTLTQMTSKQHISGTLMILKLH